jgi:hypothetical protein
MQFGARHSHREIYQITAALALSKLDNPFFHVSPLLDC